MKILALANVVICLCLGAMPETVESIRCPFPWTAFKSACYRYISTEATWNGARQICSELTNSNGYTTPRLASIHSKDENDFLYNYWVFSRNEIPPYVIYNSNTEYPGVFIGLNDVQTEGTFRYTDGTPYDFSNFLPGEPNNCCGGEDAVHFWDGPGHFGGWNDLAVDTWTFPSFCKMTRLE